jgi:hypothetical protein
MRYVPLVPNGCKSRVKRKVFNPERVAKQLEKETPAILRAVKAFEKPKIISQKTLDTVIRI